MKAQQQSSEPTALISVFQEEGGTEIKVERRRRGKTKSSKEEKNSGGVGNESEGNPGGAL